MTSQEMAKILRELDLLYDESGSFRVMISNKEQISDEYQDAVTRLEDATPGMIVVYVDLGYRHGHALVPAGN
jgi:hypothetical protein